MLVVPMSSSDIDEADLDDDAATSHKLIRHSRNCKRRRSEVYPAGPTSLHGVISVYKDHVAGLLAKGAEAAFAFVTRNIRRILACGLVVTTSYSGLGTFELAVRLMVAEE